MSEINWTPILASKVEKWDRRFLELAETVSSWSKDPSTQVGAVVVRPDRTIASVGYNGFPMGMTDIPGEYDNRDIKYDFIVHAEMNAILFAREPLEGYTLYTTPFMPCIRCAVQVAQAKISRIVSYHSDNPRWVESFEKTKVALSRTGIELTLYDKS